MNLPFFIAKRIKNVGAGSFSAIVIKIATVSIALGVAIMLASYAILGGFKERIHDKIKSFSGHLTITRYHTSNSYQEKPVSTNTTLYKHWDTIPGVTHLQTFARKAALFKTDKQIKGVLLKGVSGDFKQDFIMDHLVKGTFIETPDSGYSKEIVISERVADDMRLSLHDTILTLFVQKPPRYRNLIVKGIYETGLEEFDNTLVLGDIGLIRRLNDWQDTLVGGYELFVKDLNRLESTSESVFQLMDVNMAYELVTDKYIQIFDWLSLLDRNVLIFYIVILVIACFNIVSTLLILIMERTNMVGVLKAMGATNKLVRQVFTYLAVRIILIGLLWGNAIGLGFCALQYFLQPIKLDPANYYMKTVPIIWNWPVIIGINVLIFVIVAIVVLLPTVYISRIKPIRSIKFD